MSRTVNSRGTAGAARWRAAGAARRQAGDAALPVGRVTAATFLAAAALLLAAALAPAGMIGGATAYDPPTAPLLLLQATDLFDQFGYDPVYTRNVPSFDNSDRAHIRSRTADLHRTSFVHITADDGTWSRRSMLAALRAAYPTFKATYYGAGWSYDRIAFDTSGRAYTVVTVELTGGTLKNVLLASRDDCASWQAVELPSGDVSGEYYVGHNEMPGPPFLGFYQKRAAYSGSQANYYNFKVVQPYWNGDQLVVPAPVQVSRNCFGFSQHSGGASFAVTHYSAAAGRYLTHFVWGEITTSKSAPGSPILIATYDPATGTVSAPIALGYSSVKNDVHATSGICVDGNGYLHVLFGAHHTPFRHTMSLVPDTVAGGWSTPVDVLSAGYVDSKTDADGSGRQTYLSLVCGPDNALHIVFRQYRKGVDPYFNGQAYMALAYQRRPATPVGQVPATTDWEAAKVLVVPAAIKYAIYYHKLAIDHGGRLFVSSSSMTGADSVRQRALVRMWRLRGRVGPRPGYYLHRSVLMSDDNGGNWRLAGNADFAAGIDTAGGSTTTPTASADGASGAGRAVSTGNGSWLWMNRTPQGNAIGAVDFANARNGVAVGDAGTVLNTSNGGKSWTVRRTGLASTLFAVDMATSKVVYAVGDLGVVLRSTNGGKTWSKRSTPTTVPLFGCAFFNAKVGWVVGDGVIYRTRDGGKHWASQHATTGETLYAVTCLDKTHLWAVGDKGVILSTIDGGRHWDLRRPQGGTETEDSRAAPTGGAVAGASAPGVAGATNAAGAASATGAASLVGASSRVAGLEAGRLRVADRFTRSGPSARAARLVALYGVDFVDAKRGWAVGEEGEILFSKDGGLTWKEQKSKVKVYLSAVRFSDRSRGWVTGSGGKLLRTTDGGKHWKTLESVSVDMYAVASVGKTAWFGGAAGMLADVSGTSKSARKESQGATNDLYGAAFTDANNGVVVGSGGALMRTVNGGSAWAWRKPTSSATLRSVDLSGAAGVAVGDAGTVLRSTDGGATWAAGASGSGQALLAVDLADAQNGWAVGAAGTVLRTGDGGASWGAQASGVGQDLSAVAAVSATEAWAGGGDPYGDDDAFLLHTTDGGATWTPTVLPVVGQVTALCFTSQLVGWAAGYDFGSDDDVATGFVLRTTDGGATWALASVASAGRLRSVSANGQGAVWVCGDGGAVLRSDDWGASFRPLAAGCGQHLYSVRFMGATGFAVGAGGAILKTTNGGVR